MTGNPRGEASTADSLPIRAGMVPRFVGLWLFGIMASLPFDAMVSGFGENPLWKSFGLRLTATISFYGLYGVHLGIIPALLALPNRRRILTGYAATILGSSALCVALKMIVGRGRPHFFEGPFHFEPFHGLMESVQSFPSGETVAAFALSALLSIYLPRMRWAFWTLAALTGLARVAHGDHYLSDILGGGGLAILWTHLSVGVLGRDYFRFE